MLCQPSHGHRLGGERKEPSDRGGMINWQRSFNAARQQQREGKDMVHPGTVTSLHQLLPAENTTQAGKRGNTKVWRESDIQLDVPSAHLHAVVQRKKKFTKASKSQGNVLILMPPFPVKAWLIQLCACTCFRIGTCLGCYVPY